MRIRHYYLWVNAFSKDVNPGKSKNVWNFSGVKLSPVSHTANRNMEVEAVENKLAFSSMTVMVTLTDESSVEYFTPLNMT